MSFGNFGDRRVAAEQVPHLSEAARAVRFEAIQHQAQQQHQLWAHGPGDVATGSGNHAAQKTWPGNNQPAPSEMFGDVAWYPMPRARGSSGPFQFPGMPGPGMPGPGMPGMTGMPGMPGMPGTPEAVWPVAQDGPWQVDAPRPLQLITAALGCQLTEAMRADPNASIFAEATRLLLAVLGFICEGACPPMLRNHVISRGPYSMSWHGISPPDLLREWFDADELLELYGEESMRRAFEGGRRAAKCQFITLLSRVALVEAARPGTGRCLRAKWQDVFQLFPEISLVRALMTHFRRRCWDDARDRSRSRSRSRERRKESKAKQGDRDSQRFFLKGTADLDENQIRQHFKRFGKITNCNVLMDKRKKQFRGMCFLTMKPDGVYKGKVNTKQDLVEWILGETHDIKGVQIEVTQADEKPEEDEDRKREERVDERRLARLDKEQRMSRALGGVVIDRGEKLVPSPWFKRWRQRLWETLPKGLSPVSWKDPNLMNLCGAIWSEIAEHTSRTGDKTVKEALLFFRDAESEATRWLFVPGADILLIIGDGLLTLTALGIFITQEYVDPVAPPTMSTLVNIVIPTFASVNPPVQAVAANVPQMPPLSYSARPELNRMQKGNHDDCKIFVGGLPLSTTLDQLLRYFSAYGQVTDAVIMTDKLTGKPRGFAFICFESAGSVVSVLQHHDKHHVNGKWIDVKRAIADFLPGPRRMEQADAAAGQPTGIATLPEVATSGAQASAMPAEALYDPLAEAG